MIGIVGLAWRSLMNRRLTAGLTVLAGLTDGPTYLCVHADSEIPDHVSAPVSVEQFKGPHPAGTAGLHIHTLDPVSRSKTVWTVGYQDVIATGSLFRTGVLDVSRVVAIAGPAVKVPSPFPRKM